MNDDDMLILSARMDRIERDLADIKQRLTPEPADLQELEASLSDPVESDRCASSHATSSTPSASDTAPTGSTFRVGDRVAFMGDIGDCGTVRQCLGGDVYEVAWDHGDDSAHLARSLVAINPPSPRDAHGGPGEPEHEVQVASHETGVARPSVGAVVAIRLQSGGKKFGHVLAWEADGRALVQIEGASTWRGEAGDVWALPEGW